jgi:hypothetical protein
VRLWKKTARDPNKRDLATSQWVKENFMSLEYAAEKFGTAVAILATSVGRIQERLESAYLESIIRVERSDIPPDLLSDYDYIVT